MGLLDKTVLQIRNNTSYYTNGLYEYVYEENKTKGTLTTLQIPGGRNHDRTRTVKKTAIIFPCVIFSFFRNYQRGTERRIHLQQASHFLSIYLLSPYLDL